ncbi:MAG: serine--tRNA ligase [bacterium]|nr:serine--tRNA ligase [bacterium]
MLDIKFIRQNPDLIKDVCVRRGVKVDVDRLLSLDETRRELLHKAEDLRSERKKGSKSKPTPEEIPKMRTVGEDIKTLELELLTIETEYQELLFKVPNLLHPEVPTGGETDYKILSTHGALPVFDFQPEDHETLMAELDLVDFERGAKVAASKFYFFKNDMVRLSQALVSYGLDVAQKHGYTLVETPDVAKNEILRGIGFNPRGPETQVYSLENTDLSLIGTAEITMGGYHADEILDLSSGPKKYAALSHCFRTEAGSYGKASKGLYRVHQFTKLEMFIYCLPADSEKLHEELLSIEKEICDGLGLAYRVIDTASGDLGAPAYRKFDLEAWMVMNASGEGEQGGYGEITSTSNCTDYQARRLNIRHRKPDGGSEFVHTLNGTAVVLSRFPLAIIEQFQQADGSIEIPKVLHKYLGR